MSVEDGSVVILLTARAVIELQKEKLGSSDSYYDLVRARVLPKDITYLSSCYSLHSYLSHHAPQRHVKHKCLGWFSSQAVEKKNDVIKKIHYQKSNKWDAARDALKLAKRGENFQSDRQRRE